MFAPLRQTRALYMPPTRSRLAMRMAPAVERFGQRWLGRFAGVSVIESGKQLYAGVAERAQNQAVAAVRPKLRIASSRDARTPARTQYRGRRSARLLTSGNNDMSFSPRVIALLGFGEAGSAIARGLCIEGGWRGPSPKPGDNAPRRVIAIDTALDKDARGTALGKAARRLDVAIDGRYTEALARGRPGDLRRAGRASRCEPPQLAAPLLKKGAHYLDLCTVTGKMSDEDRAEIETGGGRYIDIAVMGGFFKQGIKAPMLVAGEDAEPVVAWMNANGFEAKLLGPEARQRLVGEDAAQRADHKGIEALGVEALVTAERQGILERGAGLPGRRRCR